MLCAVFLCQYLTVAEIETLVLLIEDFWFWGYFTTKGSGGARTFEFNDDKFYTANFIKPTDKNRKYFMDFLQILNDPNACC